MTIRLPLPPSTNALFLNVHGKGRVKTPAYKAWLVEAGLLLKIQRPEPVVGPYQLEIRVPRKMRGDIDNRLKGASDLLVTYGIIPDDKHAQRISIARADVTEMEIEVRAA